ncbi:MAG: ankyrin repeat domain-containing protein [Desertifilum sp.]|nr:ankyrin repeat domain-containing protein [Desertifilum sp.]
MELIQSVIHGNLQEVQRLIESGKNVNCQDEWGDTPLIFAAIEGYLNIARVLIQAGAKVNLKNKEGMTALMYAIEAGHSEIVGILLEAGADVNDQDNRGNSILMLGIKEVIGVQKGSIEVVQMLFQAKANIHPRNKEDNSALKIAAGLGLTDIVRTLVENGADVKNSYILFSAIDGRNPDTVRFFIQAGADVHNIKLTDGSTPLMWAVLKGDTEIVKVLLQAGVDTEVKNNRGETALTIAIADDRKDIIDLLHQAHL